MARNLLATFPDLGVHVDEVYWMGNDDEGYRAMVRWAGSGTHRGWSLYGKPTGRRVHLWGISQLYIAGGAIVEDWMLFNEFDVMAQLLKDDPAPLHRLSGTLVVVGSTACRPPLLPASESNRRYAVTVVSCRQLAPQLGDPAGNAARSVRGDPRRDRRRRRRRRAAGARPPAATCSPTPPRPGPAALPADHHLFDAWSASLGESGAVLVARLRRTRRRRPGLQLRGRGGRLRRARRVPQDPPLGPREALVHPGCRAAAGGRHRHGRIGVLICYDAEFPELTGISRWPAPICWWCRRTGRWSTGRPVSGRRR